MDPARGFEGGIFLVIRRRDEQYPTLWSQQRAVLMQMMSNPDPHMQTVLAHPENIGIDQATAGARGVCDSG